MRLILAVAISLPLATRVLAVAQPPALPWTITDYDEGDCYLVRGEEKLSYHGMRQPWVFNRAMVWLDSSAGLEGAVLCYADSSPLILTGQKQVSRWYTSEGSSLVDVDDRFTRFIRRAGKLAWDHACLPPFQFSIEQHPIAELVVREASHPWQLVVVIKGRSGPPLYASPWQEGPGTLQVDLRRLYRQKGYRHQFAELVFFVALWTKNTESEGFVEFSLCLLGEDSLVPSLPVIRTAERAAREGIPVYALVLDQQARRLGPADVVVELRFGDRRVPLSAGEDQIWYARLTDVPMGDHWLPLEARWRDGSGRKVTNHIHIRVTSGNFVSYDPKLRLLRRQEGPLGPLTGSYRGQPVFRQLGKPEERLLQGQQDWQEAIKDPSQPDYGFHFWEALTPAELDNDYAYLARCGWHIVHLCSGWLWWPRWDAAGRLSPFYAEQLCEVSSAASRHGLMLLLALSHYPLGQASPPYMQYLEAGYRREDYGDLQSTFYHMFGQYLRQFAEVFRDDPTIALFTASGEGDTACGPAFVNFVYDVMKANSPRHLFAAEPHWKIVRDPNYYRKEGWKPLLGGMRTYFVDNRPPEAIGVQFKLAGLGHLFMAEGCFYGFLGGNHQYMNPEMPVEGYRRRIRLTIYTGLAHRNPLLLTWEERIVEDERIVFENVRRNINWSTAFRTPPVAIRVYPDQMPPEARETLFRLERKLTQIPVESFYLWEDEPPPPGTQVVIDSRQDIGTVDFASSGGCLPDKIAAQLPLRLPAGWMANYSWSVDGCTLLAFVRPAETAAEDWSTVEGGRYAYVDTKLRLDRDVKVVGWQVLCRKPGIIFLRVYRLQAGQVQLVAESPPAKMERPGWCQFSMRVPLEVKENDFIGFYIPEEDTQIAARPEGHMLFVPSPGRRESRLEDWQSEPKTAAIRLLVDDGKTVWPQVPNKPDKKANGDRLVLRNFPAVALKFQIFDLESKELVGERIFTTGQCEISLPGPRDLFLIVTPVRTGEN